MADRDGKKGLWLHWYACRRFWTANRPDFDGYWGDVVAKPCRFLYIAQCEQILLVCVNVRRNLICLIWVWILISRWGWLQSHSKLEGLKKVRLQAAECWTYLAAAPIPADSFSGMVFLVLQPEAKPGWSIAILACSCSIVQIGGQHLCQDCFYWNTV